jgi:hypothetical protein
MTGGNESLKFASITVLGTNIEMFRTGKQGNLSERQIRRNIRRKTSSDNIDRPLRCGASSIVSESN